MKTFVSCEGCHGDPAEKIRLQSASSRFLWWQHREIQALLCGACAELAYYDMQSRNLIQGWWGVPSAFATIWFSITNVLRIRKHRSQVPLIQVNGQSFVRIHKNVRNNPAAVVVTAIVALGLGTIFFTTSSSSSNIKNSEIASGTCFSENAQTELMVVSCASSEAEWEVTGVIANKYYCPLNDYAAVGDNFACLKPVN